MTDRADEIAREIADGTSFINELDDVETERNALVEVIAAAIRSYAAEITAECDRLRDALKPFAEIHEKRSAHYRKRGGDPDKFPDTHPAYDIEASQIPVGKWRAAARALSSPTPEGGGG